MTTCKICGKDYKSIEMHLGTCLKKANITRESYTNLPEFGATRIKDKVIGLEDEFKEISEAERENITSLAAPAQDPNYISGHDVRKNIFKGATRERDPDRPLSVALSEFGISEEEFLALLNQWKGEAKIPINMRMSQRASVGDKEAETLKDLDRVETFNLATAEALEKNYGFKTLEVRSRKGNTPKTWVLKKKA